MIPALCSVDVYSDMFQTFLTGPTAHRVHQALSDIVDDLGFAVAVRLTGGVI